MIWLGTMQNILKIWLRYETCLNDLNGYNAKYIEDMTEVWSLFKWSEWVQCQIFWRYEWGMLKNFWYTCCNIELHCTCNSYCCTCFSRKIWASTKWAVKREKSKWVWSGNTTTTYPDQLMSHRTVTSSWLSQDIRKIGKAKQPALSSPWRWLQN